MLPPHSRIESLTSTGNSFYIRGGYYLFSAIDASFSGDVSIEAKLPDGTWQIVPALDGFDCMLTAADHKQVYLGTGEHRFRLAGTFSACKCGLASIPYPARNIKARTTPSFVAKLVNDIGNGTFTRATVGYCFCYAESAVAGDSQILQQIPAGIPRFSGARFIASSNTWSIELSDGTPIPWSTLLGYLSEEASANVLASNHRLAAGWTLTGTGSIVDSGTGIDGVANAAITVSDTDAAVSSFASKTVTGLTSGTLTHVFSVWLTKGSATEIVEVTTSLSVGTFITAQMWVDTSTGQKSTDSAAASYVLDGSLFGRSTEWLAVVPITDNGTGNTTQTGYVYPARRHTLNGANDATLTGSVTFDWAQIERNTTVASSPIVGGSTRNADVESEATSGNIVAASGTIALTYTPMHNPSGTVFLWGTYVDASNYTAILHDGTNLIFRKRIAATNYDATIANAFVAGTTYKMAASWGSAGTSIDLDGTLGTPNANTTAAQIGTTMQTGADGNGANQPGMYLKLNYTWQSQLSDAVLQEITA